MVLMAPQFVKFAREREYYEFRDGGLFGSSAPVLRHVSIHLRRLVVPAQVGENSFGGGGIM